MFAFSAMILFTINVCQCAKVVIFGDSWAEMAKKYFSQMLSEHGFNNVTVKNVGERGTSCVHNNTQQHTHFF